MKRKFLKKGKKSSLACHASTHCHIVPLEYHLAHPALKRNKVWLRLTISELGRLRLEDCEGQPNERLL